MGLAGSQGACLSRLRGILEKYASSDSPDPYKYDVVISFAREDRRYAKQIADYLTEKDITIFYDEYMQHDLWGKNLYEHLSQVYQDARFFCVLIISKNYADKIWTNHERRSAQARALKEKNEYILPIKLDNSTIPGLLDTVAYIDLREIPIETICEILFNKVLKAIREYLSSYPLNLSSIGSIRRQIAKNIEQSFSFEEANAPAIDSHDIAQRLISLQKVDSSLEAKLSDISAERRDISRLQSVQNVDNRPNSTRSDSIEDIEEDIE